MINKEAMREWVSTLYYGKYDQTDGQLEHLEYEGDDVVSSSFCCLGVACDLFKNRMKLTREVNEETDLITYNGIHDVLPEPVADYLGLESDPVVGYNDHGIIMTATDANDVEALSFKEIAVKINARYELGLELK